MPETPAIKVFSDRARASALAVRRHQQALGPSQQLSGMANPKIAARVKEILAAKQAKGKKKAGGKGKADAAKKKAAAVAKKAERAKAQAAKKQEREKAKIAHDMERTGKQAARKQAQSERVAAQAKKQAAQQKKLKAAAQAKKEKAKATQQHKTRVLSEKLKRGEKLSASDQVDAEDAGLVKKSGKAMDMSDTELAVKAGARHSKMDASHLDEAARHLHAAGATCPDCAPGDEPDGDAAKAIKGIMDNPAYYAQHECSDIMQGANALSTLAMLIQSELSEEDEDDADISQLVDAARTLVKFIDGELDELEGAASDAADGRTAGDVPMAKAADDYLHIDGGAIKAIGDADEIGGYAVLFGDAQNHDMERDYYTKATNFWLDDFGWPRPITYHHGMDAGTRDNPVIGHWTKAAIDDTGVWLSGQLDRAHAYYKAIKELAQRGYLKLSSDSAPQWVQREKQKNGANFVKRWPLVTASATVTPMEPRMLPVEVKAFLAEIGYEAIDGEELEAINPAAVKADGRETATSERARAILLELDILALEETAR